MGSIAWNLMATLTNQGSTFVTTLVLARMLDAREFGTYVVILSTGQIATLIASAGMGFTATKYLAEFSTSNPQRAARVFGFCLAGATAAATVVGLAIALGAPHLARDVFAADRLAEPLRLAGGICLFMTLNAVLTGALAGLGEYRLLGLCGIASGLLYAAITITATIGWSVQGTACGLLISAAFQTLVLLGVSIRIARRRGVFPDFANAIEERPILTRFALPAAIAGITTAASIWVGQLILVRQPDGLVHIGLYNIAANLLTITLLAPSVANTVGMSMLNSARGARDSHRFDRLFRSNLAITLALVTTCAVVVALLGRFILSAIGPAFVAAYPALLVLLVAAVFESTALALYQTLQSRERMWQAMRVVILPRDIILPALAFVLAPSHGALGLAIAYLVSRGTYLVMTAYATRPGAR